MDSSNGLSRRAGNAWLPAGLAALLWSLEKADPIPRYWKNLNITQAVKSLLETGSGQSERCSERRRISSLGLFFDSTRDFHSKVSACSNFGIGVSLHAPVSCPKFYCGEDDCDSTCCRCSSRGFGGCNDPSCDSCDICDLGYLFGFDWSEVFALEPPHQLASSRGFLQVRSQSTDSRQQSFEQDDRQLYLTVSRPNQVNSTTRISEGIRKGLYKTKNATGRILVNFGRMLTRRSAEGVAHRVVIGKADSEFASEGTTTEQRQSSTISLNHSETENASGQVTRKERETRAAEETELERPTVYATENGVWISAKVSKNALQDSVKSSATSPAFGLQRVLALPLRTCSGFRSLGNRGQVLATVAEWQACSSSQEDSSSLLDKKETGSWNFRMGQNAIAGALAGAFVSLCLHPIDTIKTVIQAQTGQHHNLFPVLSSIISQRGLRGLYRGLGSNLASSAPTSAIYTFTYEAVKLGLLPFIPQGMSALAHCTAGGCASLATSIVYTPSECVKQQMQLGTLYRNSWLAFVGLLKNGGLPLLYSGWGAVLCRNVPQSVIKVWNMFLIRVNGLLNVPLKAI
jgi:hypothetical protein